MSKADVLLEEIIEKLRAIDDVQAMWLSGSFGRGTADEFSDLDIWVAIASESIHMINADPKGYVNSIVPTVMHVNAPSIAPSGGSFLGSWVPISDTFVQVDWYFTPSDSAERDPETKLIFGDVAVGASDPNDALPVEDVVRLVNDNLVLALIMIGNFVKHARRGNTWEVLDHARHADRCLVRAHALITNGIEPDFVQQKNSFLKDSVPSQVSERQSLAFHLLECLRVLAVSAGTVESLYPAIEALRNTISKWQESATR